MKHYLLVLFLTLCLPAFPYKVLIVTDSQDDERINEIIKNVFEKGILADYEIEIEVVKRKEPLHCEAPEGYREAFVQCEKQKEELAALQMETFSDISVVLDEDAGVGGSYTTHIAIGLNGEEKRIRQANAGVNQSTENLLRHELIGHHFGRLPDSYTLTDQKEAEDICQKKYFPPGVSGMGQPYISRGVVWAIVPDNPYTESRARREHLGDMSVSLTKKEKKKDYNDSSKIVSWWARVKETPLTQGGNLGTNKSLNPAIAMYENPLCLKTNLRLYEPELSEGTAMEDFNTPFFSSTQTRAIKSGLAQLGIPLKQHLHNDQAEPKSSVYDGSSSSKVETLKNGTPSQETEKI